MSSPVTDSIVVHVSVEHADPKKARQLTVRVPSNAPSVVFEIKRALANLKEDKVDPLFSRVRLVQDVDDISLPYSVIVHRRVARDPFWTVNVLPISEKKEHTKQAKVDPTDSGIDLKFILEPVLGVKAEHIKLYVVRAGFATRVEVRDGDILQNSGITNGSSLLYMLEVPSIDPGHGAVHRTNLVLTEFDDPKNRDMGSVLKHSFTTFASKRLLGTRSFNKDGSRGPYQWLTYAQVQKRVNDFGQGLSNLGVKKPDTIGIMSNNRTEWDVTDFTCGVFGFVSVPLYDTLGPDAVEYIIKHASISTVVVNYASLKQVARVRSRCPSLINVVLMDDTAADKLWLTEGGSGYTHLMSAVEKLGQDRPTFAIPQQSPDDIYTICYTSGTTGNPKGAVLSHRNVVSAAAASNERMPKELQGDSEIVFSYLPLAHIYERLLESTTIMAGHAIGFSTGDNLKLVEDVAELKPSLFPGVPRVWQRVYDRVNAQLNESSLVARSLFRTAYATKLQQIRTSSAQPTFLGDRVVFKKIAARFGGNVKLMISGAAPLNPRIAEFMRIACQTHFVEGYGLTETCAVSTLMSITDGAYGVAGSPATCVEVKLVDVPDMEYLTTDRPYPRGEIWVRGPNIFKGYFKQPDITAECMTNDGWFMTGDVGLWLPDGNLKIIDRKKNIFKLSQGEYIRPEYIESVYKQTASIANIYVHGDSTQNSLVAIIVPNLEILAKDFPDLAPKHRSLADWAADSKIAAYTQNQMAIVAKKAKLRGFEIVKHIHLATDEPTVENGLLTPSFKLKRHEMKKKYEKEIAAMYAREEQQPASTIQAKL